MSAVTLLGDLGGTNFRVALLDAIDAVWKGRILSRDDLIGALKAKAGGKPIERVLLAVAGPVRSGSVVMTNRSMRFDAAWIAEQVGAGRVEIRNDFVALGLALPDLDLETLAIADPAPNAPALVIGPGTGLGACIVVDERIVLATEAGHQSFAPADAFEGALAKAIAAEYGHCSVERLVSGPGLERIYAALAGRQAAASEVGERAHAGEDAALAAIERFTSLLGAFAGDMTLAAGAQRGVYLAGGMLRKLAPRIDWSHFHDRFASKGRYAGYLAAIPRYRIRTPHAALIGLARLARGN